MVLIDTSAWIDFFRGALPLSTAVERMIDDNEAALCGPVLTEIRRGVRSAKERAKVMSLLGGCHQLEQPDALWTEAGELGAMLGGKGATVKSLDLLIATYALAHGTPLLTRDRDFRRIRQLGVPLVLVDG